LRWGNKADAVEKGGNCIKKQDPLRAVALRRGPFVVLSFQERIVCLTAIAIYLIGSKTGGAVGSVTENQFPSGFRM